MAAVAIYEGTGGRYEMKLANEITTNGTGYAFCVNRQHVENNEWCQQRPPLAQKSQCQYLMYALIYFLVARLIDQN